MFRRIQSPTTRSKRSKGFTLIEVMMATVLFTAGSIAVSITLFHAFRAMARARYLDRATNVLKIAADQFQSSKAKDPASTNWRTFFTVTPGGATGEGLAWNSQLQTLVHVGAGTNLGTDYIVGDEDGLLIPLKTVGSLDATAPVATLTRMVEWVAIDPATNTTSFSATTATPVTTGGQLVRGTFRIEFDFMGRTEQIQAVVVRNLNPTDK